MKFLREPLVQFLLIGAALFGLFSLFGQGAAAAAPATIVITPELVDNLRVSFARQVGQPPTPAQLDAAVQDYLREEIFFREAKARGLDADDPLVRRQLRTRMEAFYEDTAQTATPTDAQLRDYLQAHEKDFRRPDGAVPALADIHQAVQDAWVEAQRQAAVDTAYEKLRANYRIVLPPNTTTAPAAPAAPGHS